MHAWKKNVVGLALTVVAALGLAVPGAVADTITVCWDGSGQYLTIQEGIDAAKPGDEVVVCDGTYTGPLNKNLDFAGKAITVRSQSGDPEKCIIDCWPFGRGFYFHSGETNASVVDGFTIQNGSVSVTAPGGARGGGIYNEASSPTVTNCTFRGNSAHSNGGGMSNSEASPTVTGCTFIDNHAWGFDGGGMYNSPGSYTTVANCTFVGNVAHPQGVGSYGGGMRIRSDGVTVTNCTFTGNWAVYGGGMNTADDSPTVTNCTFSGNSGSTYGGGMCIWGGSPTVTNCTFSGNSAPEGGGIWNSSGNPTVTNCILWGDSGGEIYTYPSGFPVVTYCDVQGGYSGTGNIDEDPLFVDPGKDDYHLQPDSPCIDKGDPRFVPEPCETDMDGEFRVWDGDGNGVAIVDMGADEFGSHVYGDLNCDGAVNFDDIDPFVLALSGQAAYSAVYPDCEWLLADINCDGAVNFDDIDPFVALLTG